MDTSQVEYTMIGGKKKKKKKKKKAKKKNPSNNVSMTNDKLLVTINEDVEREKLESSVNETN